MAAKEVEDTCDDSFELEHLEGSFDDLEISGRSYFNIEYVVYFRVRISKLRHCRLILLFSFLLTQIHRTAYKYPCERSEAFLCKEFINKAEVRRAYETRKLLMYMLPASKHNKRDTMPDHLKGVWFYLKERFFQPPKDSRSVHKYNFQGQRKGSITKSLTDIFHKGIDKIGPKFDQKNV